MSSLLIINIKQLAGIHDKKALLRGPDLAVLPSIENAYLLVEGDEIAAYGRMEELDRSRYHTMATFDAEGRSVIPAWCDSHTHLVFAASREEEFIDKIKGLTYAEIAAKGGGILNSSKKLNEATEDELFDQAWKRLEEIQQLGTGAVEIKSGYGLTVEGELKMLRVIRRLKQKSRMVIKSTFLGAHTYPVQFRDNHQAYIDSIVNDMLPVIAGEKLADYIDVFCETGFFSPAEMETLCIAGARYGLKPKLHVNQLNSIGGVQAGIRQHAVSLDHLETMTEADIRAIAHSSCVGTLLPTAAFFLRMPLQPARQLIESGAAVALASDYNPGSSPSGNMNLVVAISCIQMKMLPEEAINAATINGAYAMEVHDRVGSISKGKKANLIVTKNIPSLAYLPYSFGSNLVDRVMVAGEWV